MIRPAAVALALLAFGTSPALAHSAARGFVLLLPTAHVIAAGAIAVLISFAIASLLPDRVFQRAAAARFDLGTIPSWLSTGLSLASFAVLLFALWIGFNGPHDPLENLLPLLVWTLFWVMIVLIQPVLGNIWAGLNPFSWVSAIILPPCRLPERLSYVPAILIFAAYAWFQLVYPAPDDPARLARVVSVYAGLTLAAVAIFGAETWLRKADPFGILLYQLSAAAAVGRGSRGIELRTPGSALLALPVLPIAGVLFVLLTLSSISFDGLSHTFLWLSVIGVNPLEYPGRTAIMWPNTLGLIGAFLVLAAVYVTTVTLGWVWAGRRGSLGSLLGQLIYSLIPISIAYHFAHYIGDAPLNAQNLLLALNDPSASGVQLLGIEPFHVTASFQNTASGALTLFTFQTGAIIVGHIIGVAVAHAMALDVGLTRAGVARLEAPLAIFMLVYTAFGLWLLATPVVT